MWQYKIGVVVQEKDIISKGFFSGSDQRNRFGHIIGFAVNVYGETILRVKWDDEIITTTHPNNVTYE